MRNHQVLEKLRAGQLRGRGRILSIAFTSRHSRRALAVGVKNRCSSLLIATCEYFHKEQIAAFGLPEIVLLPKGPSGSESGRCAHADMNKSGTEEVKG